jgi:hypothetical protein
MWSLLVVIDGASGQKHAGSVGAMSPWRRWCSRWSGAEAALAVAWGAFASGLLAAALVRDSAGILALAAFCAWQLCDVWVAVQADRTTGEHESDAPLTRL